MMCVNGHAKEGDNLYVNPKGGRECRQCRKDASKRYGYHRCHNVALYGGNRDIVLERDGHKCVECGLTREEHRQRYGRDITIDHIDGNGINSPTKNNSLGNLQTLCLPCHGRKDIKRSKGWKTEASRLKSYANLSPEKKGALS